MKGRKPVVRVRGGQDERQWARVVARRDAAGMREAYDQVCRG